MKDKEAKAILIQNAEDDQGPESKHTHLPSTSEGSNTASDLARRLLCIRPRTNHATIILERNGPSNPPPRDELFGYIEGVRLSKSIDPESTGTLKGFRLERTDVTSTELPNHVPTSYDGWADT